MKILKLKNLLLIVWFIIALISIFLYVPRSYATSPNITLTYVGQPGPLFSETNIAPLDSVTKQITVANNSINTQKFALNLRNFLGTSNAKLATVLKTEISRDSNILYTSHLSDLKDSETFLENIIAGQTYTYDIKVTMDDVGNDYQSQEAQFDIVFGWINGGGVSSGTKGVKESLKGVLGTSIGPSISPSIGQLPETGADIVVSILAFLLLLAILAGSNILVSQFKRRQ